MSGHYERSHLDKHPYETWVDAFETTVDIYEAEADRPQRQRVLTVYRCCYCPYWHIGHPRGSYASKALVARRLERARRKRLARRALRRRGAATEDATTGNTRFL